MYSRKLTGQLKHIDFIAFDFLSLLVAFFLSTVIYDSFVQDVREGIIGPGVGLWCLADLIVITCFNAYKNVLKRGYLVELWESIKHAALVVAIYMALIFMTHSSADHSRIITGLTTIIYLIFNFAVRVLHKHRLRSNGVNSNSKSLMIVAAAENAESVVATVLDKNYERYRVSVVAIIDGNGEKETINDIPVIYGESAAIQYAISEWIDEALIVLPRHLSVKDRFKKNLGQMGIVTHQMFANRENDNDSVKQKVQTISEYVVLTDILHEVTPAELILKRLIDIVGGLVGCLFMLLLTLIIGPMIYIQSPGPIFFRQERVGRNGKRFYMVKFRSMHMDAEERKAELMAKNRVSDGMMFKLDADPRIIGSKVLDDGTYKKGIGNFIRESSIDEFPQFINVLKGDMSLVGTRPPTVDEWDKYELYHRSRMAIKPGITGLWQVSGRSTITSFDDVVALDNKYIDNWSIGMDFRILFKTVKIILTHQEGAL